MVNFCLTKTLGLVDSFWLLAHSRWLKAQGICLFWTISTAADIRLCALLGRLEWHLWGKNIIPATMYEAQALCQISLYPALSHYGDYSSHFTYEQTEAQRVHCVSKFTQPAVTKPGSKSRWPSLEAHTLPTLLLSFWHGGVLMVW